MKIYFNRKPVSGPWGGGSKVLSSIISECLKRGHNFFFQEDIFLSKEKFDIIFCVDPRPISQVNYQNLLDVRKRTGAKIVQRVGDIGTHGKPDLTALVSHTVQLSDKIIFPSNWAKDSISSIAGINILNAEVISNAPLKDFIITNKIKKDFSGTIKLVSHHWSNNEKKGFDIYESIDEYCESSKRKMFDFTFIGRKPDTVSLKNHIPPQDIEGLVSLIPQHQIYLTASKQEAGANHVLEALGLGLPVLYHEEGGSINEYCKDYGISYGSFEELIWLLENRMSDICEISNKMCYKRTSEKMAEEYVELFESLL